MERGRRRVFVHRRPRASNAGQSPAADASAAGDPYAAYKAAVGASFATAQTGLLARLGSTAEDIAAVITQAREGRP